MKLETAEAIKEAAEVIGSMGEFKICDKYSGRGMFGSQTVALEYEEQSDLMVAVAYASAMLAEAGQDANATDDDPSMDQVLTVDDFIDEIRKFRHDNMGRDFIVY